MPRGGDFVSFLRPGGQSFALKSCPRGTEKISGLGVSLGGWGGGGRVDGNRSN